MNATSMTAPMPEYRVGFLYRSRQNTGFLYRIVRLNKRSLALSSRALDGSRPVGGPVDFRLAYDRARELLVLAGRS